jgi:glycosyltransferase involved in cell wall biosynthesis
LTLACAHDIYYEPPQNLGFTYELVAALGSHAMHDLYCKTDMFACPSWYEGFSLPVLESMACGVPVVVTENLGTDGWCEDGKNCLRVPNHSPIQLSDAIITLMEDPGLAQRLATAGIESAHVHGLRRQFDEFTEAFERILEVRFDRRLVGELRRTLAV